ncbi:MAG: hypothetical protein ACI8P0_006040 [Planctomycetaceae bacterium]|jgi:hypothetical protein
MNHFGIGKLDESRRIHLPIDLLRPINIVPDVAVWGMYYPKSLASTDDGERHLESDDRERRLDFVLSPIPFELWPRTARLTVRTKHRPGAFRRVTEFLKKSNVTILVSEGSRSAHRYDTWTMIVALERSSTKKLSSPNSDIGDYSVKKKGYGVAAKKFQALQKKLHEAQQFPAGVNIL